MADARPHSALEEYLASELDTASVGDATVEPLRLRAMSTATFDGAPPGPDLDAPMAPELRDDGVSRLILILRHLAASGDQGMTTSDLITLADRKAANQKSAETMIGQDIDRLRDAGWDIENLVELGGEGRYVMKRRDLVGLTAGEKSVLQGLLELHAENGLPNPADHDVPECIWEVAKAVDHHSVVSMLYKGHRRQVHPVRLHTTPAGWWLRARDEGGVVKWFRLDRMSAVELGEPWSADSDIDDPGDSLNPHTWAEDPPVRVRLEVPREHLHSVLLTFPGAFLEQSEADRALVDVRISNRAAFFGWLVETGTRVRLLGPDEVVDEVRTRLREVAGA